MSVKTVNATIGDVYIGSTPIEKICLGATELFSKGISKIAELTTYATAIEVDDDYVYVACRNSAWTSTNVLPPDIYVINKRTRELTQLTNPFTGEKDITYIYSNGSIVLFMDGYGDYAWYDKNGNTFSSIYSALVNHSSVYGCCIDGDYSYFGVREGITRINNSTKAREVFDPATWIDYHVIGDDENYVYLYADNNDYYIFNKSTLSFSLMAGDLPSGITGIRHYDKTYVCQNSKYIFQCCMNSNSSYNYNQILVVDKINKTLSTTSVISELKYEPSIACNENYLFVMYHENVYIFDLTKNLVDYTIEDINNYVEPTTATHTWIQCATADNKRFYLGTSSPVAVFKYVPKTN